MNPIPAHNPQKTILAPNRPLGTIAANVLDGILAKTTCHLPYPAPMTLSQAALLTQIVDRPIAHCLAYTDDTKTAWVYKDGSLLLSTTNDQHLTFLPVVLQLSPAYNVLAKPSDQAGPITTRGWKPAAGLSFWFDQFPAFPACHSSAQSPTPPAFALLRPTDAAYAQVFHTLQGLQAHLFVATGQHHPTFRLCYRHILRNGCFSSFSLALPTNTALDTAQHTQTTRLLRSTTRLMNSLMPGWAGVAQYPKPNPSLEDAPYLLDISPPTSAHETLQLATEFSEKIDAFL